MTRKSESKWDGKRISELRKFLGMTQNEFAQELGIRQQTVSEWETGAYKPRGASLRLLDFLAQRQDFSTRRRESQKPKGAKKREGKPSPKPAEEPTPGDWAPWAG